MEKTSKISTLELFLSMRPKLEAAIFRRVGCRTTAADLVQDTWLHLARIEADRPIGNAGAYVHRVAVNLALDHVRSEKRRATLGPASQGLLDAATEERTPERVLIGRDQIAAFRRAVADLPEQSRRIFFMNRFEGKPHRRIAQELGVSETTVNFHIRRVLQRLSELRDTSSESA
ncbi:RNA polymerase sigma factor [Microbacteriaceae bacterium K1510]|nr:RNA polymerase sigma factor [Microbacteriaceae bacterium K1510]